VYYSMDTSNSLYLDLFLLHFAMQLLADISIGDKTFICLSVCLSVHLSVKQVLCARAKK